MRLVYDASGIRIGERRRLQLEARVAQRLRALHVSEFEEYERRLDTEGPNSREMEKLLDVLAVHESYFFREVSQLSLLAQRLVPEARQRRGREPVRVWSAGCAAAEEPYSVAMLLEENGVFEQGSVEILGTDLSTTCLDRAREGVYPAASLRKTSRTRRERFFQNVEKGVRVEEAIRRRVRLQRLNLYRDAPLSFVGHFDIILCRNVLLYFDLAARHQVVDALCERLRPSGALLLGCSETLLNVATRLEAHELDGEVIYRRRTGGPA